MHVFITGTDTGVGKTYVSTYLLNAFKNQGYQTLGIKPIATGCNEYMQNEDALALQKASSIQLPYEKINPFAFSPPIAPHIAAQKANRKLSVSSLLTSINPLLQQAVDLCLIEGVGGWQVPLNDKETMADFVVAQQLPVILVVGMRLGCLNHALLTANAIQQSGAKLLGWIANCIEPDMPYLQENIDTIYERLTMPCLEVINHRQQNLKSVTFDTLIKHITNSIPG